MATGGGDLPTVGQEETLIGFVRELGEERAKEKKCDEEETMHGNKRKKRERAALRESYK
jgi:hypothetical protein